MRIRNWTVASTRLGPRALGACLAALAFVTPALASGGRGPTAAAGVPARQAAVPPSDEPAAGPRPIPIRTASLVQRNAELVWELTMSAPFSPSALARDGRTLCVRITGKSARRKSARPTRATDATAPPAEQLCLLGPARHRVAARVALLPLSARARNRPEILAAHVSRSSSRQLTAVLPLSSVDPAALPLRWQVLSTLAPPRCHPPHPDRVGCYTTLPAVPATLPVTVPLATGCVASGPSYVTNLDTTRKVVALTFDDGPAEDTPQFLDILEREHAVATFFQIGDQESAYGRRVDRRMLADGDVIGDHTWNHHDVSAGGAAARQELEQAAAAIQATSGLRPCLFRAPYGDVSPALISLARSLGMITVAWNVDPRDWARPGATAIYDNVVGNVRPGSIVLQHDGGGDRSETLSALPQEIDTLRARGYTFVTIPQLLGLRMLHG